MTILAALPSVSIALNQTRVSPAAAVPLGLSWARAEIDGSGWPANAAISARVEISPDGGTTWTASGGIDTTKANLLAGKCSIGLVLAAPNANASLRVRASVTVKAGGTITLVGNLTAD